MTAKNTLRRCARTFFLCIVVKLILVLKYKSLWKFLCKNSVYLNGNIDSIQKDFRGRGHINPLRTTQGPGGFHPQFDSSVLRVQGHKI